MIVLLPPNLLSTSTLKPEVMRGSSNSLDDKILSPEA